MKSKKTLVYGIWPCLACKPSYRKIFGRRICGHKKDTVLKAPLFYR